MMRPKATPKGEEKSEPTRHVFAVGALVFLEQTAEQRLALTKDPRNLHPKEKVLEVASKMSKKHRSRQTTVTPQKTILLLMNSQKTPQ